MLYIAIVTSNNEEIDRGFIMTTHYYLCDQYGKYVSQHGFEPMLVKSAGAAYFWNSAEAAQAEARAYSVALGTECRVVAHVA